MKVKATIPKILTAIVICLFTFTLLLTQQAFALYNGDGSNKDMDVLYGSAPGYEDCNGGYRIYLTDKNTGKLKYNSYGKPFVFDIVDTEFKTWNLTDYYYGLRTDPDVNLTSIKRVTDLKTYGMPYPLIWNGSVFTEGGTKLHQWMITETTYNGDKVQNIVKLIDIYFLDEGVATVQDGTTTVVIEPLYNLPLYFNYSDGDLAGTGVGNEWKGKKTFYTGERMYGTFYDSVKSIQKYNVTGSNPHATTGGWVEAIISGAGDALKLERDEFAGKFVQPPARSSSAYIGYNQLGDKGYGMHAYTLNPGGLINTYDPDPTPPIKVPAPAETPSDPKNNKGEVTIVKVYGDYYKDASGKIIAIENVGQFIRKQTTNRVIITDETTLTGYSVVDWYTF